MVFDNDIDEMVTVVIYCRQAAAVVMVGVDEIAGRGVRLGKGDVARLCGREWGTGGRLWRGQRWRCALR